jgi:pimeloyl-ACP methyl ester carboxylesterase
MNKPEPDWASLSAAYGSAAVQCLKDTFQKTGFFAVTGKVVTAECGCPLEIAEKLLEDLARQGFLAAEPRTRCPFCGKDLTEEQCAESECVHCNGRFTELAAPQQYQVYTRAAPRSRDVKWVVTIHGMNTDGTWQQECAWRLAKLYGYSIPVAIYKYGNIKISPFLPGRRRFFTRRLIGNLKRYGSEMRDGRYGERPDVIAHSFGTWLLFKALLQDKDLKVGRVILTGSIIPPDYNWKGLIDSGRVGAVLCHRAGKDLVVRMAQFGIAGSGPSGYRGFNRGAEAVTKVMHKFEPEFGHSDFFLPANLPKVMESVWTPFLTTPDPHLPGHADPPSDEARSSWSPSRWRYLTLPLKSLLLSLLFLAFAFMIVSSFRGINGTWRWIWGLLR